MQLDVEVSLTANRLSHLNGRTQAADVSEFKLSLRYFLRCDFLSSDLLSSLNFGPVTDIHTEYDAYEPTVHTHRWAKKVIL